ncbi:chemotaxis protein CheA [Pararhodospirillum oryzae]|uniref:Chemotaxis protein CheA n=1 Tax=Pararhodospirillum oryzae TaxID=478448 RepID=A0A512H7A5_9PROT|nr:chemotaxis protein CheA [Pararhodospirillum oryzae]GEO81337.1 chemotaxis protein CheA [Pararhodospirillum oryzae]
MTTPLLLRFVEEARDLLQLAASGLLTLERAPDNAPTLNEVFRAVHTLKGSAGLFDIPAFLHLVHAGEDVLSAVRDGSVVLTSDLVDLLLDALDRVGAWVDALAETGTLPADADGLSRDLTLRLRAVLPEPDPQEAANAATAAPAAVALDLDWVLALPEAERLAAFHQARRGQTVLALEYRPAGDCFYSGEDPLALFRQVPDLLALTLAPAEPWAPLDSLDPYACVLVFRALTGAPRLDIETLFRYVIEQVALAPVPPEALLAVTGEPGMGPMIEDYLVQARDQASTGAWDDLRATTRLALDLTGETLQAGAALRALLALLDDPAPDPGWIQAVLDCLATGQPLAGPDSGGRGPEKDTPDASPDLVSRGAPGGLSPTARALLESQRRLLEPGERATLQGRLVAVGRTVANVLEACGQDGAAWREAVAVDGGRPETLARLLETLLETDQGAGSSDGRGGGASSGPVSSDPAFPGPAAAGGGGMAGGAPAGGVVSETHPGAPRILKVDQGRVDALMALIGELVVSKNSLPFLARRAETVFGSREMAREIKDLYAVVDRLAQEMQSAIMAVRMLPVSEVFERFPRLVRDVARRLGKQADLVIEGEETAADKNIIEILGDPLLHILRNALDHGVELPAERVAAGKPALARLLVRAFQESDQVVIEITDDGRGIDPDRIREAAIAKGVISAERAARLSPQESINLVFLPGFSTASAVSDLSGRGVGMDVVVTTIEKAGGSVVLSSVAGQGTTVRLSLPLSMAVTRVMMVEAGGGQLFGIPMDHIAETVRIPRTAIRRIKHSEAFVLRSALVPLLHLDALLGIEPQAWFGDETEEEAVLVVRLGQNLIGLVVDHFREGMDIILKPFDGVLAGLHGYAGTALLGDGRVLLVLNLKELL